MAEAEKPTYLTFVKFDLICKEFERQYHEYYDEHVREWALKDGCSHGWRTREMRGAPNEGLLEQEFWQIYHIDNPHMFGPSLATPAPTEKNPWLRDRSNWARVYYRILSFSESNPRPAKCWARFEMDFNGAPEGETAFREDCAAHIARVIALPGIHRAWQLEHMPHELAIGQPAAAKYMCLYEIDAPENIFDADLGAEVLPMKMRPSAQQPVPVARHLRKCCSICPVLLDARHNTGAIEDLRPVQERVLPRTISCSTVAQATRLLRRRMQALRLHHKRVKYALP